MIEIKLPAGGREHNINIPRRNLSACHTLPDLPAMNRSQLRESLQSALETPIGRGKLRDMLRGKQSVTVIVDDWSRPPATRHQLVPVLLDCLNERGIGDDQITVLMARGLALCPEVECIQAAFGDSILGRGVGTGISGYHPGQLKFLGHSSLGTPVWIDRRVAEADLVIGVGTVSPSSWGGWSGGAKIVVPGVAGAETIRQNHSLMVNVVPGSVDNLGFRDREEIAGMAGLDLLINSLVNLEGEILDLAVGEPLATHRHLRDVYRSHYQVELPGKVDIVIATLDRFQGYPQGAWYATSDACLPAVDLVANAGATLIAVGSCPEGVGGGAREYMRTAYSLEDLARLVPASGVFASSALMFGIHFAIQRRRIQILSVVDGLSEAACIDIGIGWHGTVQDALDAALVSHGVDARVAVIAGLGNILLPEISEHRVG